MQIGYIDVMDISLMADAKGLRECKTDIKNKIDADVLTLQKILSDFPEVSSLFSSILKGESLLSNINLLEHSRSVGEMPSEKFSALMYAIKREIQIYEYVLKLVSRPTSPVVSSQSAITGVV